MRTVAALCVVLLSVCVWASADEGEAVTNDFVSSPDAVHPRMVQNLAVLSTSPRALIKARTVARLPHHKAEATDTNNMVIQGDAFSSSHAAEAVEVVSSSEAVAEEVDRGGDMIEAQTVEAETVDSEEGEEQDSEGEAQREVPRFAEGAPEQAPTVDTRLPPPKPIGVSVNAAAPTPAQPVPKPAPEPKPAVAVAGGEVQRVAVGSLDGPVQRHGDKPDAILDFVKDILPNPDKEGLPDATLKTTKVVGKATCGKGCSRKLPVMVGWSGLNEAPAHKTGRRVVLPGDHARTRARHEALKVPSKYTWRQRHLDDARKHLKRASKRIRDLRLARKKIGDAPLMVPVVV